MAMLIVEQGATIESQRALLRELLHDSAELSAIRAKAQQDGMVADTQRHSQTPAAKTQVPATRIPSAQMAPSQTPSTQTPSTQTSSNQASSNQTSSNQTPSSQAAPQHRTQNQTLKQKQQFEMPSKPATDLVDDPRNLITI